MRLQEIYYICKDVQASWSDLSYEDIRTAGILLYHKLKNPDIIRKTLSTLEAIDFFRDNIKDIRRKSVGFAVAKGEILINVDNKSALTAAYRRIESKINTIIDLFESLNYGRDSDGFDIKLPAQISLSDLSKCTRDLDTIFSTCPLFANQQGTITFSAVDVGSIWLSFVIGGVAVAGTLRLIAELVDKALVIRSHHLTSKAQEEQIRSLQLGNDILENAVNVNKNVSKGLMNQICSEMAEEHDITDPEDIGRLKNSIQLLSDWMNKGMEVYASVQASPEVKAVFPTIEKQSLPESFVALLTEGSSAEE